ncbi:hypothetical protein EB1_20210 [Empedobacter brevis NBRC 14943 = ATCC 43319]|uniref:Uncharacterized protein n=1 Tax=Empedobacter brevis NBRC 14943 = ATCC 43319 TaxID=1218108 RepID=A0A511NJ34_9FLAO|nr:hypothetical protein EB1_20210 [Empedobacter brevis NBRC 14943 = ATCC 43319]
MTFRNETAAYSCPKIEKSVFDVLSIMKGFNANMINLGKIEPIP